MKNRDWLALDVGGANIKASHQAGGTASVPFKLWKHPRDLHHALRSMLAAFPPFGRLALTMTGELCDCFVTKAEGVRSILAEVVDVVGDANIRVWGTDGGFHPLSFVQEFPLIAAAANWLALAEFAATLIPDGQGLCIDIGSTTTDIIAIRDGKVVPRGRTDMERLTFGELIYAGAKRTPACALASEISWKSGRIGLAAELFATTLDVNVLLGSIGEDSTDTNTADGRPVTLSNSRDRLARMICGDRDSLTIEEIRELAVELDAVLMTRLVASARKVLDGRVADTIVISGSAEFLARRVAESVLSAGGKILSVAEIYGPSASTAGCAYALLALAQKDANE